MSPRARLSASALVVLSLLLAPGCATLFARDTQRVYVESRPPGAVVYAGSRDPVGQTPLWVSIEKDSDVTIRVVQDEYEYECAFDSAFGLRWLALDLPLVVPIFIDLFLGEGSELTRAPADRFGPRVGGRLQLARWQTTPVTNNGRCFADFVGLVAMFANAPPPADGGQALESIARAEERVGRVVKRVADFIPERPSTGILRYARRGFWFSPLVHAGISSPSGLAGGGLELGYTPWLSLELSFGASFDSFISDDGPDLSAIARARAFAVGERWIGVGGGFANSRNETARGLISVENARWVTAEAFIEQPFARLGVVRFSGGAKHMVGFDRCMPAEGERGCGAIADEVFVDIAFGFVL